MVLPFTPGRGPWRFVNVTRSFDWWARLESISITDASPEELANLDCLVDDPDEIYAFQDEDVCEAWFDGERIFAGHIKATTEGGASEVGHRVWTISGQDYTAKLDDAIVRRRTKRKRERVRRRVKWLLSYMPGPQGNIWPLAGTDLSGLPGDNPYVEAAEYFGNTVREALEHVADELRLHFYIDFDNVFHIYRGEDLETAPFRLNNDDPDMATSFPFSEWQYTRESTELSNAVLVEPEQRKDSRWTQDSSSIGAYKRQERFVSDSELGGSIAAGNVGARTIAASSEPELEATLLCWQPGLRAGHRVRVKEALWDHDELLIVRSVETRGVDPHDDEGDAYLKSYLTLSDRERSAGSVKRSTNKNSKKRPGQTVDTGAYVLTTFPTAVTPPTLSDDVSIAFSWAGTISHGRSVHDVTNYYGPTWTPNTSAFFRRPSSAISGYSGWTSRPAWTACSGLDNSFQGFGESEDWLRAVMPAVPADFAGIEVTCHIGGSGGVQGPGYGEVSPIEIMASTSQPVGMREGGKVGEGMRSTDPVVFIPADMCPAEGEYLWLGYRTKWNCEGASNPYAYACGWTWPFMSNAGNLSKSGLPYCGRSGRVSVNTPTGGVLKAWVSAAPDLGDLATDADAPWQGGNNVYDAGTEGEPDAWFMDGESFGVSADTPSGKGIYVVGNREDESEAPLPSSDVAWAHYIHFRIDAHGSTTDAGTRSIESTTTGEGEQAIGTIHLGDSERDEGISVSSPSATVYLAKPLTLNDEWVAKFDTRSGLYVRGKLWRKSDGEPAAWDVELALDETEDAQDRWMLWVRAGNDGTTQTATVLKTRAQAGASSGQRIVKEWIGRASGIDKVFKTAHPFRRGSLRIYVNGIAASPASVNGPESSCHLDFWPTARSGIKATYIVE